MTVLMRHIWIIWGVERGDEYKHYVCMLKSEDYYKSMQINLKTSLKISKFLEKGIE